ncbi:MAG: aminopeptidase P family protein [Paludibacteraceae bacterium]|nr:aminopeptidase P family protein [Paludibacteraceae bacterium]MBP6284627.1 aminopeptidase P family protein [Paludibacteraceae bacterium]
MLVYTESFKKELTLRWAKIQAKMKEQDIDACFISTNVNIWYTLGRIVGGYVYLRQDGEPLIFLRRPVGFAGDNVFYIRKVEQIRDILADLMMPLPESILMEGDEISYAEWMRYQAVFDCQRCINSSHILRQVRSVKTDYEVDQLTESARLQSIAYKEIPLLYRPNMNDHEFTVEIERLFRLKGNLGIFRIFGSTMEAFMGSVLVGENAEEASPYDFALGGKGMHSSLPFGHSGQLLEKGKSIMVDINGNFNGYISDQTRTFSIGELTEEAYYAHNVSIEIQQILAEMGKPGVPCEELYHKSLQIAKKHNLEDCYMGLDQQAKFVGHGVGLVINELPVLCDRNKELLETNMTIALEPKFIIKGIGAVGTENTFVVREQNMEKLTFAPEEIIEL